MKQVLFIIACAVILLHAGCNNHEKTIRDYQEAVKKWEEGLHGQQDGEASLEEVTVTIIEVEGHNYVKGLVSYFCLAIDGQVVFKGEVEGPEPVSTGVSAHTELKVMRLSKGKHIIEAFDVARAIKVREEIEISKGPCWILLTSSQGPPKTIRVEVNYREPFFK